MADDKAEMRFSIDPEFLEQLQQKLGLAKTTDVARTALTVLNWAADEVKNGRVILSTQPDGSEVHRLVVPGLTSGSQAPTKAVQAPSSSSMKSWKAFKK